MYRFLGLGLVILFIITSCDKSHEPIMGGATSNIDQIENFGIYRIVGDSFIYLANGEVDLDQTNVILEPFIGMSDIKYFDLSSLTLHLNRPIGWNDLEAYNPPFLLAENGNPIREGYFYIWPNCCWPRGPMSLTVHNQNASNLTYTMQISGAEHALFSSSLPDSLVRRDLDINIDSVTFQRDSEKIVSGNFSLTITNLTEEEILFINPEQAPDSLRLSICQLSRPTYLEPEFFTPYTSVRQWDSIPDYTWSEEWYVEMEPGESIQIDVYSRTYFSADGEQEIVLTLDNLAGTISRNTYESMPVKPWLGRIIHVQVVNIK